MKLNKVSKYDGLLAQFYDADHSWRNYKKQISPILSLFPDRILRRKIQILDICCGTGSHIQHLARNGFQVTGIDRSSAFLRQAKEKINGLKSRVRFWNNDFFMMNLDSKASTFNCAILLGWTLTISPIYKKFPDILARVYKLLKTGGLFFFDAALGPVSHKISSSPLRYTISPKLRGNLRIHETVNRRNNERKLTYRWDITKHTHSGIEKFSLTAREVLSILSPQEIHNKIEKHLHNFEVLKTLRDYRLDADYRRGDKNLIVILRKK